MNERGVHKQRIRKAFDRAAERYDSAAAVQREACERLARFATVFTSKSPLSSGIVVDAGCGTGLGLPALAALCPDAYLLVIDLAAAMLEQARRAASALALSARLPAVCGDLEHLPFAGGSLTLLWSSLALQWCAPEASMREIARTLAPGGQAYIATLGPRTLHELQTAFAGIDQAEHRIAFHDVGTWAAHARGAGLDVAGFESLDIHALAPDLRKLLRDIKTIGASTVTGARRRAPLGRAAWQSLEDRYEIHRRADGLLPATYDLILLALHKPKSVSGHQA